MPPFKFLNLLVVLLAVQAWCKPAKNLDGVDYNDDDPPSDYNEDENNDENDDPGTFEEPPQIMSKPESIRVRNGSTIWLPCLLKNAETFSVTWKKDDELLYVDSTPITLDKNRIVRLPNNTLVIYNATVNDTSDHYECSVLHNTYPAMIEHRVLVDSKRYTPPPLTPPVQPHTISIEVEPAKRVNVTAGGYVTLGCKTKIQPEPTIKWYHENERVGGKVIVSGSQIMIPNVTRHDAGRYRCLVENDSKNPPMESINVVVKYAPEIETKGKWVHTGLGVESRLTCIVHAHPSAEVRWFKDGEEVTPKKGVVEMKGNKTRHVLEIMHTDKKDLGEYSCMAENKLGRNEKTISLTGVPSQAIISGGELTQSGTGWILKWQLESYSPITEYKLEYRRKDEKQWSVLKPTVTNGRGNQFFVEHTIEGLQPGSYEAILMARNDFGWSPPSKPHLFRREYVDELAERVKGPSSIASSSALTIATIFTVLSSYAFRSL